MDLEQKNNIISQYNEVIEDVLKSGYVNDLVSITYKSVFDQIELIDEDRADVFIINIYNKVSYIVCMWLFISDTYPDLNDKEVYPIKLKFELYNIVDSLNPIAFKNYKNEDLTNQPPIEMINYLSSKGDKIYNDNGGRRLLARLDFLNNNNIDVYLKEFITRQAETLKISST